MHCAGITFFTIPGINAIWIFSGQGVISDMGNPSLHVSIKSRSSGASMDEDGTVWSALQWPWRSDHQLRTRIPSKMEKTCPQVLARRTRSRRLDTTALLMGWLLSKRKSTDSLIFLIRGTHDCTCQTKSFWEPSTHLLIQASSMPCFSQVVLREHRRCFSLLHLWFHGIDGTRLSCRLLRHEKGAQTESRDSGKHTTYTFLLAPDQCMQRSIALTAEMFEDWSPSCLQRFFCRPKLRSIARCFFSVGWYWTFSFR